MTTFYIILVAMLLMLALFDLFVGVSNDAVNFLSSAVGSKAFKYKTLMIFAAVGVFCFQGSLHHFTFLPHDLSSDMEDAVLEVDVIPLQTQQFATP